MPDKPKLVQVSLPESVHRDAKIAAAQQGRPLREVVAEAVRRYVARPGQA